MSDSDEEDDSFSLSSLSSYNEDKDNNYIGLDRSKSYEDDTVSTSSYISNVTSSTLNIDANNNKRVSNPPTIILQNIDNINEYYGIDNDIKINLEMNINMRTYDNKIQYIIYDQKKEFKNLSTFSKISTRGGDNNETTKLFLKVLNKFLAKHKYIIKENKLYTLYDMYTDNVVCIIANFDNLYIIQIKEEFYKDNKKILNKFNKDDVKTKLEELYQNNNLEILLS